MKTEIKIDNIIIDNADLIKQELSNGKNWQITIYDGTVFYTMLAAVTV